MNMVKPFLIGVAVLAIAVPVGFAGTESARVTLLDRDPVTVKGTGFAKRERVFVRVLPAGGTTFSKIVVARDGTFTAVFPQRELGECSGYTIVATGRTSGTRATRRELIPPACGIQIIP